MTAEHRKLKMPNPLLFRGILVLKNQIKWINSQTRDLPTDTQSLTVTV